MNYKLTNVFSFRKAVVTYRHKVNKIFIEKKRIYVSQYLLTILEFFLKSVNQKNLDAIHPRESINNIYL